MRATTRSVGNKTANGSTRGLFSQHDDSRGLQGFFGKGIGGVAHQFVERFQNYGMSSVPLPADDSGWGPESVHSRLSGNSIPVTTAVDDRRHRPRDMQPGESFQYDDQGQGTLIRRGATYVVGGGNSGSSGGGGGGGGASLAGSTEVQTPDGFKNIQQLQLGDQVVSYSPGNNKSEVDTVVGIHVEITEKKMMAIGYPGGVVHCTEDHLIWSERRKSYVRADQLYFNEKVRNQDHLVVVAESVKELATEPDTRVYHLTIKKNHNFFVREAGSSMPLLVHNQGGGGGGGGSSAQDRFASFRHVIKEAQGLPQLVGKLSGVMGTLGQAANFLHEGENATADFQAQMGNLVGTAQSLVTHYIGDAFTHIEKEGIYLQKTKKAFWTDGKKLYVTEPPVIKPSNAQPGKVKSAGQS